MRMPDMEHLFAGITAALKNEPRDDAQSQDWLLGYDKSGELVNADLIALDADDDLRIAPSISEVMYVLGCWKRQTEPYPMPVVRPVKPAKKMENFSSWGVYGNHAEFFVPMDWNLMRERNPMPITWYGGPVSPWRGMEYLGIDITDLRTMAQNECPCAEMTYTAFVPVAVLTDDSKGKYLNNKYRHLIEDGRSLPMATDMIADGDWNRTMNEWFDRIFDDEKESLGKPLPVRIGNIERAVLGSGYNDCILPSDGCNGLEYVMIPLNNGDHIICVAWEWSNK
jgi:hypothetical protein